jgi:hypothetical protein
MASSEMNTSNDISLGCLLIPGCSSYDHDAKCLVAICGEISRCCLSYALLVLYIFSMMLSHQTSDSMVDF